MTDRVSEKTKKFTSIRLGILFYMAWRNLMNKKLRSLLTITGVVIGIGSIFFLLSFGLGVQELVTKEIIGSESVKTIDVSTTNSRIIKLDKDNVAKMRALPHAEKAGVLYSFPGSMSKNNSAIDTITYGVDLNYQLMTGLELSAGRLLEENDNKSIVLNKAAVETIGFPDVKSAIGKSLTLQVPLQNAGAKKSKFEANYTIVGVVSSSSGSEVYIPSFHFDMAGVPAYSQVRILVDDTKNIPNLRKQIETLSFQTSSPSDTIEQVNQIFNVFNAMLVGFGAVSMVVAVLGMFNTLTISLLERTKEIGLMMALGGRRRDMSKLFIIEALLLSVAGASTGIFFAIIAGQVVNLVMVGFAHGRGVTNGFQLFATPPWLVLSLIGFMAIVGLVVAWLPARRATKIDPIDALRRE